MADKPILVSAAMDGTIRFWDMATQKNTSVLQYKESQVNNLCITPDGTQLALGAWQNLRMYSLKEPTTHGLHTFNVHDQKNVTAVGFQADGKWMYTGGEDGMAKIWDMRATQLNCQRIFQVNTPIHSVALHPNQVELMVADSAGALYVWDLRGDRDDSLITEVDMSEYIVHVDIDQAGRQCAAVTNRGHLFMWNICHSGMLSATNPQPISSMSPLPPLGTIPLDSNGTSFVPQNNNEAKYIETNNSKITQEQNTDEDYSFKAFGEAPCSLENAGSLPPLGNMPPINLNSSAENTDLNNLQPKQPSNTSNLTNEQQMPDYPPQSYCDFFQQQSSYMYQPPNFGFFPPISSELGISGVPASMMRPNAKILAHSTFVLKCRYRPDGLAIATTSADQTTKLWSSSTYKLLNSYTFPGNKWVWECAFTNDSKHMITATSDGMMRMWDLDNNEIVRTFQSHSLGITAMAFRDCA